MKLTKESIKEEMNYVLDLIIQRGMENNDITEENIGEFKTQMVSVDTDSIFFQNYDTTDLENHNYDLGRYHALKEILSLL